MKSLNEIPVKYFFEGMHKICVIANRRGIKTVDELLTIRKYRNDVLALLHFRSKQQLQNEIDSGIHGIWESNNPLFTYWK